MSENDKLLNEQGVLYTNKQDYDKAVELFLKAIEIDASDEYYNNLGIAYVYKKEYPKAIEAFQKALEINPDNREAYYNIEVLWW